MVFAQLRNMYQVITIFSHTEFWTKLKYTYSTVKLGDKELLDKEQLGVKELFSDYHPFHIINLLLDKELLHQNEAEI